MERGVGPAGADRSSADRRKPPNVGARQSLKDYIEDCHHWLMTLEVAPRTAGPLC